MATTLKNSTEADVSFGSSLVLPGDRPVSVVEFEGRVVDFFVGAADILGVPKSVAAIYGIVFASPVPLSFAEIEARLDISKGSVSQGLRVLREVGALKVASVEHGVGGNGESENGQRTSLASRRGDAYVPDLELRKLVARFLESRLEKQLSAGSSKLTALSKAVPGKGGEAAELKKRLQSLSDWHSKARTLLPLARTVLKIGG